MKKLFSLFVALIATCALWANNVITYTATSKLYETVDATLGGLHTNAFNVSITSHTFSNDTGTITFSGDVTSIGDKAFYECYGLISITIPNSVTSIGDYAFDYCSYLTSITIPNSVTSIGDKAFYYCYHLTSITIPNSVTSIGRYAFDVCTALADIYCYAVNPPTCPSNAFEGVSKHCYVHVPAQSIRAYQFADVWRDFYHFLPLSELPEGTPTDNVGVSVEGNYATFSWPVNPTASSYTLTITKDGVVFCTLTFNSLGQLVGMGFAPARDGANHAPAAAESTAYGYAFVVSGLEKGMYDYTFTINDSENNAIETYEGTFTAEVSTALNETTVNTVTKLLRNGLVIILRDGNAYNVQGVRVEE